MTPSCKTRESGQRTLIIGLTGSIGMGKSTAAALFRARGVPVHDADAAVHKALQAGGQAVDAVGALFPDVIEHAGDPKAAYINRQALGQIVFQDPAKLKRLEAILHPIARAESDRFVAECQKNELPFCVLDIPLLFETGGEGRVDVTVCVTANAGIQHARVLARPGMSAEKFHQILERQMPDAEKRRRADYVITSDISVEDTGRQIDALLDRLKDTTTLPSRT